MHVRQEHTSTSTSDEHERRAIAARLCERGATEWRQAAAVEKGTFGQCIVKHEGRSAKTKSEMVLLLREEHVVDATAVEVGGVLGEEAVSM